MLVTEEILERDIVHYLLATFDEKTMETFLFLEDHKPMSRVHPYPGHLPLKSIFIIIPRNELSILIWRLAVSENHGVTVSEIRVQ